MTDNTSLCYFHPKVVVVGVCALCLYERLLVLASKQEKSNKKKRDQHYYSFLSAEKKNDDHHQSRIHYLPKMFALSSLLSRLDIRHDRKVEEIIRDPTHDDASTCSYEDSFISIKFENNGVASWEKGAAGTVPKVSLKHCDNMSNWSRSSSKESKGGAVIEHAKPRMQLRWRKRIGHIFQLIRLKRSSTTKLEGVKVRPGWIRTLTKRKTKE
nr:PREDICTED: uncharacterized protein LOC107787935 [Nicotiana tabacum]